MTKDLFSLQSDYYAKYRPGYPAELFEYIVSFVKERKAAWDCATGNGQAAAALADYFERVEATDISEAQLSNAIKKPNVHYSLSPAERTPFPDDSFDLITVATAYHWLNWKVFHDEATRVAKPGAVIAAWAYNLVSCENDKVTDIIEKFYYQVVKPYWDYERKYVDESYITVDFNFDPLPEKEFHHSLEWTKEQLLGYLQSWSAVQKYIQENNVSPLLLIQEELNKVWPEDVPLTFHFPLFLKIGRVVK